MIPPEAVQYYGNLECKPQIEAVGSLTGWPGPSGLVSCGRPAHDWRLGASKRGIPAIYRLRFPTRVISAGILTVGPRALRACSGVTSPGRFRREDRSNLWPSP
jgi:hypothetical protein